jgi:hypothetical protein
MSVTPHVQGAFQCGVVRYGIDLKRLIACAYNCAFVDETIALLD